MWWGNIMKVIKNYLYNLSYQILTIILPIITVPYVTRIFTSEDLGNYGFYNSIVSYFSLFAMLGIGIYGTKQVAAASDVSSTFWNIYAIQFVASLLALSVYLIAVVSISQMRTTISLILGIVLLTKMLDISWLFSGKEDFKKITLRNTVVKVTGVISIFTFIKSSEDLYLYVFLIVIFDFLGQSVMWIPAKQFLNRPTSNLESIKKNLRPTILLFLPQVAISLYKDFSPLILFKPLTKMSVFSTCLLSWFVSKKMGGEICGVSQDFYWKIFCLIWYWHLPNYKNQLTALLKNIILC